MRPVRFTPIGIIHTPYTVPENMPIQPSGAMGIRGHIILNDALVEGLRDLDGFSHVYLLYHLHLSKEFKLQVVPFLDHRKRGLFATRAPKRPNPVGLSVVKLIKISGSRIEIENVDMVDGSPLLDIKPFVGEMEGVENIRIGWLSGYADRILNKKSDGRFQ